MKSDKSFGVFLFLILTMSLGFPGVAPAQDKSSQPTVEAQLLERIRSLEERLTKLEAMLKPTQPSTDPKSSEQAPAPATQRQGEAVPQKIEAASEFLRGTTINVDVDGYYLYNANRPISGYNQLRAYDISHNSFSLNQAGLVIERLPDLAAGSRLGMRLDLMYGQATQALQGSAANEPRPDVYRPLFQAYGSYIFPVGQGLTVKFGKFASALGFENNYTKDQINYSRSYYFNFLPFYHFGLDAEYQVNDRLAVAYWLVNGANQTEEFNAFKSQAVLLTLKPEKNTTWNVNYFSGQESPTRNGLTSTGRLHIIDTYMTHNFGDKWTLAAEYDYVVNRTQDSDSPARVQGAVGYAKYQITPAFFLGARFEYLSDRGGLFSGKTQALKDSTLTATYQFAHGYQMRAEWRRDSSNQPFFSSRFGKPLRKEQNTLLLGMIWWFGGKPGGW
jgi:hypothetical protein